MMQLAPEGPSRLAYRDGNVLRWLTGFTLSLLGDQIYFIALAWAATQVAGPSQVGLILAAGSIPRAVLLLFGGAVADKFGPRRLVVISDTCRAAVMAVFAIALVGGQPPTVTLVILAVAFGIVDALFLPAVGALPARLVANDQLVRLQGMRSFVQRASLFVGAPIAGWITADYGVAAAFGLNAVLFAISVVFLMLVKLRPIDLATDEAQDGRASAARPCAGLLSDIRSGLNYALGNKTLRSLLIVSSASEFGIMGPLNTGLPLLATENDWGAKGVGLMVGGFGVGAAVSALVMVLVGPTPRAGLISALSVMLMGSSLTAIGLAPSVWWATSGAFVLGIGGGSVGLLLSSLILVHTPAEYMARVIALSSLAIFGSIPIAYALTGLVAGFAGADVAFLAGGLFTASVGILALGLRSVRNAELPSGIPAPASGGSYRSGGDAVPPPMKSMRNR